MSLKLVLLSPHGTIGSEGTASTEVLNDLVLFIQRLEARGVQLAIWSRRGAMINKESVDEYLSRRSGVPVRIFYAGQGGLPIRQRSGSVDPILDLCGVQRNQTILIGNTQADLQAGVNNQLLLIRPEWYKQEIDYGFGVESISNLARFCELFALRSHPVYWSVDADNLQVRAMGPFSTFVSDFAHFGADARMTAKADGGERRFWFLMIISTLYFSGLVHEIDYITAFPGHQPNASSGVRKALDAMMTVFSKCFRKPYLPDLIIRHLPAIKSQFAAQHEKTFRNQLNTLCLNPKPRHYDRVNTPPSRITLKGRRVLVVDDFCTNGRSLDVARSLIEAAGGKAYLFAWLKTINAPYLHMLPDPPLSPFAPNTIHVEPKAKSLSYHAHVLAPDAPHEIGAIFDDYKKWHWP